MNSKSSNDVLKNAAVNSISGHMVTFSCLIGLENNFREPLTMFLTFDDIQFLCASGKWSAKWCVTMLRYMLTELGRIFQDISDTKCKRLVLDGTGVRFLDPQYLINCFPLLQYYFGGLLEILFVLLMKVFSFLSRRFPILVCYNSLLCILESDILGEKNTAKKIVT